MTTVTINKKELNKVIEFHTLSNTTTFKVVDPSSVYNGIIGIKIGLNIVLYLTNDGLELVGTIDSKKVAIVDLDINITIK